MILSRSLSLLIREQGNLNFPQSQRGCSAQAQSVTQPNPVDLLTLILKFKVTASESAELAVGVEASGNGHYGTMKAPNLFTVVPDAFGLVSPGREVVMPC
ncbi:unnamed protein product [Mesocestoides corti]|uniref:FAD-binding PCMH-type domain-containing protein n=1 Tax=Mesocestoides corti TaxID=53468 RepID=A0A0R3U8H9_MESCO|nr:unnamed protein product [Mesocestoides corti]